MLAGNQSKEYPVGQLPGLAQQIRKRSHAPSHGSGALLLLGLAFTRRHVRTLFSYRLTFKYREPSAVSMQAMWIILTRQLIPQHSPPNFAAAPSTTRAK